MGAAKRDCDSFSAARPHALALFGDECSAQWALHCPRNVQTAVGTAHSSTFVMLPSAGQCYVGAGRCLKHQALSRVAACRLHYSGEVARAFLRRASSAPLGLPSEGRKERDRQRGRQTDTERLSQVENQSTAPRPATPDPPHAHEQHCAPAIAEAWLGTCLLPASSQEGVPS